MTLLSLVSGSFKWRNNLLNRYWNAIKVWSELTQIIYTIHILCLHSIPAPVISYFINEFIVLSHKIFFRLVKTLPCITVYMSSLTNMAIALDRYQVIVKPNSVQVSTRGAWLLLPLIVLAATSLSFPITYKTKLVTLKELMVFPESIKKISLDWNYLFVIHRIQYTLL